MTPGRVCIGASRLSNARLLQSTNVKRRSSGLFKSGLERSDVTWQCRSARYSPAQRLFSTSQIGWTLKVQTTGGQAMSASHQKKTIVVGVDGSDQATAALDWAIRLAGPLSAEIVAVFAVSAPSYFGYGYETVPPSLDPKWRAQVHSDMEQIWCRALRESGLPHRMVIEDGRPARVIADVAYREDADLVVVGRRGRGGIVELLLGSVSHELTHQCDRPVMVVSCNKLAAKGRAAAGRPRPLGARPVRRQTSHSRSDAEPRRRLLL